MPLNEERDHQAVPLPYVLPKTVTEERRITFQDYYFQLLFSDLLKEKQVKHKLYAAPLPSFRRISILDVGCGTNAWGYAMCHEFPESTVVGVDTEPASTLDHRKPINYRFVAANILQGLPFPAGSFHFVHQRLLVAGIPASSWPVLLKEMWRVTVPGGYAEILEGSDRYTHRGPRMQQFLQWSVLLSEKYGLNPSAVFELGSMLHEAGFHAVVAQELPVPLGNWKEGDRSGPLLATDMHAAFIALKAQYVAIGVRSEQYDQVMAGLIEEWNEYHTEYSFLLAYGQR